MPFEYPLNALRRQAERPHAAMVLRALSQATGNLKTDCPLSDTNAPRTLLERPPACLTSSYFLLHTVCLPPLLPCVLCNVCLLCARVHTPYRSLQCSGGIGRIHLLLACTWRNNANQKHEPIKDRRGMRRHGLILSESREEQIVKDGETPIHAK